jgi:hypothetical protein
MLRPFGWREAHTNPSFCPLNDRAFDDTWLTHHERFCTGSIHNHGLQGNIQFAPSSTFSVKQLLPAGLRYSNIHKGFGNSLLFEVVKDVVDFLLDEVSASFFNGVAIGNAVEGDRVHVANYGD